MLWYDRGLETRVSGGWAQLEHEAKEAGHGWIGLDAGPLFADWMTAQPLRETLLEEPDELATVLPRFERHVSDWLGQAVEKAGGDDLVAVRRCGALFGLARLSRVVATVEERIRGRVMFSFPGRYDGSGYRMLDARPGWNYRAIPIPPEPA
jgi:hypothetical protein